ncbi:FG-GAP-like repeat-containing protein [Pseudarthrobacter sp. H2]|uniref:FG-GAP-like repeat-containing protein n=1 Tax=Pseudarthrobacter sp. H2 TaxID=3418415 RepID=UPI003CF1C387
MSLSGRITDAYNAATGTTNVAFARAVDSKGRIWNGNYPTGSATRFDPATGVTIHSPRVHADAQYVRSLAIDANDNVYAGTGALNPRIVTWHTDRPTQLREILLPGAAAEGFVYSIAAHSGMLFVSYQGALGKDLFRIYDLAAAAWRTPPWSWIPAQRISAALPVGGDVYAVRYTAGIYELMRIDFRTLAAETVCAVPGAPSALSIETSNGQTLVHLLCGAGPQHDYVKISVAGKNVVQAVKLDVAETPLKVQALVSSLSGTTMFFGGYLGDGIGSVELVSREIWRSATDTGIAQIEGMFQYDESTVYVGSYGAGRLFRFNPQTKSITKLIELREKYLQSRPVAWTRAAGKVVAGTVAEYGHNTGALVIINPLNNAEITVVSGPVPGQSVVGLAGDGDIVYGTTGVKGGYGSVDDTKPAHVFAWNVRENRIVWKRPLPGEVEINSPLLVRGILYVSTSNGVLRLDKDSGNLVFTYRLLNRSAVPGYRTSSIAFLPQANSIVHLCGGTATVLDPESRTKKEILRGRYTDMVVTSRFRLYFAENGTNVVEIDASLKPTIRSAADLVTVGPDGWLYVARSLGEGKFAVPIRADSAFGTDIRSCHVVDWNGDGTLDVLATRADGRLQLFRGLRGGGFAAPVTLGASGWHNRRIAVGVWGSQLAVLSADRISGHLLSWPGLASDALGQPAAIGWGWTNKPMVMLVPSRTTASALIVNDGGSLYRYARTASGGISTSPVRISTGGYSGMTAFSPVLGHKTDHNGIVGVDAAGAVAYSDVAGGAVGKPIRYAFLMKSHKFANS